MHAFYWLIAFAVLAVIDIISTSLICIWFGGGCLVAFVAALLGAPVWLQILIGLVVSIILLIFTRPVAVKYFNNSREQTNANSHVGKTAKVIEDIDNIEETGAIKIAGVEWTARSEDGSNIEKGNIVKIIRIEGVKAIVSLDK
ncbi:MAG: NfeD family protein [Lachnospiraceae bacterium]|nr:NfeD family protein [Lachnospiraceae bacterium]